MRIDLAYPRRSSGLLFIPFHRARWTLPQIQRISLSEHVLQPENGSLCQTFSSPHAPQPAVCVNV